MEVRSRVRVAIRDNLQRSLLALFLASAFFAIVTMPVSGYAGLVFKSGSWLAGLSSIALGIVAYLVVQIIVSLIT